jgi:hypothetical protein
MFSTRAAAAIEPWSTTVMKVCRNWVSTVPRYTCAASCMMIQKPAAVIAGFPGCDIADITFGTV